MSLHSQLISPITASHFLYFQLTLSILKSINPFRQFNHLQSPVLMMLQQISLSFQVAFQIDLYKHRSTIKFNFKIHRSAMLTRYSVAVNVICFLFLDLESLRIANLYFTDFMLT